VLTAVVLGVVVFLLLRGVGDGGRPADGPHWREVADVVLSGTALPVMLAGIVVGARWGAWAGVRSTQPEWVLIRGENRELRAQVWGRLPLRPGRLTVAGHMARRLARTRYQVPFWSGAVLLQAGRWDVVLAGISVLALLVCLGAVVWQSSRARRLLREHPDPATAPVA
jgi:hypothetical protein